MLGRDLRIKYTQFFVDKGAIHLPSDSLVPNDPTLLFTSAGMVQFKPYFLGQLTPPATRATTVQKCLRTTDIESVGDTSHCTFFEMLGNFSFGDYFKPQAIAWAWEFLFDVLKLDLNRVRVSIYNEDDEAFELWRTQGMPERKIFRFDEHDNYWPAGAISLGPNGPCGPCSEIFYDTKPNFPPTPDGVWDDNRWMEIWNLVFMTYERKDGGVLVPLPRKNIDTGMGLERTAAALQDLRGPFETDLFAPILERLQSISGKKYGSDDNDLTDIAFRRVADHVRATTFCLNDGVIPSNIGRGYVLRRLMRRAILAGRNRLGLDQPLLVEAIPTIIQQYSEFYPELPAKQDMILRYAAAEEQQFRRTLESGSARLQTALDAKKPGEKVTGDEAFTLFATYGFPVEMTSELASERGIDVDLDEFAAKMAEHAVISEGDKQREVFGADTVGHLRDAGIETTRFTGYDTSSSQGKVLAILREGAEASKLSVGDEGQIVLNVTPFYAEAGGQVADTGIIIGERGVFDVADTQKSGGYYLHSGKVRDGELRSGDTVTAEIDVERRRDIQRNHSATHLLHKALQMTLGGHVQQRGSLVAPDRLRFDFSHDKPLTSDEIAAIEAIVNDEILADLPVEVMETNLDDAKKMGAMMLFGEKYGSVVRVVKMGDFSLEFCGGTHLDHTAQTGPFRIVKQESVQSGVRRIEAVTGKAALRQSRDDRAMIQHTASLLNTPPDQLIGAVERIQSELKSKSKELATTQSKLALGQVDQIVGQAQTVGKFKVAIQQASSIPDADALKSLATATLARLSSGVVMLSAVIEQRPSLVVVASADAVASGIHAGNIVKSAAQIVGGGGGGRPDAAQAGGKDPSKLDDALEAARTIIIETLKK